MTTQSRAGPPRGASGYGSGAAGAMRSWLELVVALILIVLRAEGPQAPVDAMPAKPAHVHDDGIGRGRGMWGHLIPRKHVDGRTSGSTALAQDQQHRRVWNPRCEARRQPELVVAVQRRRPGVRIGLDEDDAPLSGDARSVERR